MATETFKITAPTGLHARPATVLVQTASKFTSDITITYQGKEVNLKSIMGVMSLGAGKDAEVEIKADGDDADQALAALKATMVDEKLIDAN